MSAIYDKAGITLYHGDCLEILPTLDIKAQAIITDPPYGVAYRSNFRKKTPKFDTIQNDAEVDSNWIQNLNNIIDGSSCLFMFTRWDVEEEWRNAVREADWKIKSQVIWHKPGGGMGDLYAQFCPTHENAIFAVRGGWKFPNKRPMSVYTFTKDSVNSYTHPTQKPLALMTRIVLDLTKPGDLVIDPFFGSCSTGVACVQTGRKFIGCEIDKGYYNQACEAIDNELRQAKLF